MKHLKIYLLPYSGSIITIQLVFLFYTPFMLHPFVYIYPVGIANRLPRNLSLGLLATAGVASAIFFSCCIALSFERFFALRYIRYVRKEPSKIPFRIFVIINITVVVGFVSGIAFIQIDSLNTLLIVPIRETSELFRSRLTTFPEAINIQTLLIFRGAEQSKFSAFYIIAGVAFTFPVFIALGITIMNVRKFHKLKRQLPPEVFKSNRMLLKLAYLHLLGMFLILGCPILCIGIVYWAVESPCYYVNLGLLIMNFFGFYDTFTTILCIAPYRQCLLHPFKKSNVVSVVSIMQ